MEEKERSSCPASTGTDSPVTNVAEPEGHSHTLVPQPLGSATTVTNMELAVTPGTALVNEPDTSTTNEESAPDATERSLHDPVVIPPSNFAMVAPFVYRSSFPSKKHFPFLKKIGIKSIITLSLEPYPPQNLQFLQDHHITLFRFCMPGNKEPFVDIPKKTICAALAVVLDKRNHPILIHCNKGKHRTGCVVGCLRRLQNWSHTAIFNEYRAYSHPKSRNLDQQFIELFDVSTVWPLVDPLYLPDWPTLL